MDGKPERPEVDASGADDMGGEGRGVDERGAISPRADDPSSVPTEWQTGGAVDRVGPSAVQVMKGASGLGVLWGGAWAGLNVVLTAGLATFGNWPWELLVPGALRFGIWGFLCGAAFALVLTTMERKHSLEELSIARVGLWGATGGFLVVFSIIMVTGLLGAIGLEPALLQSLQGGVLGAASAAATTWMAKAAPDGE